jgi:hypothetical protein
MSWKALSRITGENRRAVFGLGTSPDGFALTPLRFLPIPVMKPRWIDWGPKDDLSFARIGRLSWKERGPAGTKVRTTIQISAEVWVSAIHQVRTSHRNIAPGGMLRRNPPRRPGFQKSSSSMVGGGLGHEISSQPVRISLLWSPGCTRGILRERLRRGASSPGTTPRLESLCSAAIVRCQ